MHYILNIGTILILAILAVSVYLLNQYFETPTAVALTLFISAAGWYYHYHNSKKCSISKISNEIPDGCIIMHFRKEKIPIGWRELQDDDFLAFMPEEMKLDPNITYIIKDTSIIPIRFSLKF